MTGMIATLKFSCYFWPLLYRQMKWRGIFYGGTKVSSLAS